MAEDELKIPVIPLKLFKSAIDKSPTLKRYGFRVDNEGDYISYKDRIYFVHVFDMDGDIDVWVKDIETSNQESSNHDFEDKNGRDDTCKFLSKIIRKKIIQEAKEIYFNAK